MGSAKFSNEGHLSLRKLAALWGTNNQDHQARICHSTTVAGVANTWGYGAMTNSYNDIRKFQDDARSWRQSGRGASGRDATSAEGKELNNANFIVMDRASRARLPTPPNTSASGPAPTLR